VELGVAVDEDRDVAGVVLEPVPDELDVADIPPAAPMAVATLPKNPGLSRIMMRTVFTSLSIPFSICMAPS